MQRFWSGTHILTVSANHTATSHGTSGRRSLGGSERKGRIHQDIPVHQPLLLVCVGVQAQVTRDGKDHKSGLLHLEREFRPPKAFMTDGGKHFDSQEVQEW